MLQSKYRIDTKKKEAHDMPSMPLIEKIRTSYPDLSQSERLVADYICERLPQVSRMSIRELKQAIGVSEPTVFRFCQAIGFRGFKEFKICLAEQTPTFQDYFTVIPQEGKSEVQNLVEQLLLSERDAIETTMRQLDYALLERAAQMIVAAKHICLFGVSTSFDVCRDVQRRFNRLGLPAWASNEFHDAVAQLSSFEKSDLLVCISQSGCTREVLDMAKSAVAQGLPVLSLTAFPSSRLAEQSTLVLQTYAPEVTGNRLGLTTRIAQYAMVDALYMAVAHRLGDQVSQIMESSLVPIMRRPG